MRTGNGSTRLFLATKSANLKAMKYHCIQRTKRRLECTLSVKELSFPIRQLAFVLAATSTLNSPAIAAPSASRHASTVRPADLPVGATIQSMDQHGQSMDDTGAIGGGSINERGRVGDIASGSVLSRRQSSPSFYNPSLSRSHLFHALEGLYRYPNYLSRWNDNDIDSLEQTLLHQVDQVRQQREKLQRERRRAELLVQTLLQQDDSQRWKDLITPPSSWQRVQESILDPVASRAIFGTRPYPTFVDVVSGNACIELPPGPLVSLMNEELPDVFSMQLLSKDFSLEICAYVQALARLDETFGRHTVNLDHVGLDWLNDLLFALVLRPIARHLFTHTEIGRNAELDWRHGYVAGYAARPNPEMATRRERLVTHTDDSEVTLNICLGNEDFEGGLLEFRGLRGTDEQGELQGNYQPKIGKCLIHAGRHFHDVTPVTSGSRFALILWARSLQGVRSTKCPCCWLNRRQDSRPDGVAQPCICGPQWN